MLVLTSARSTSAQSTSSTSICPAPWLFIASPSQNARPCALPKRFIACLFVVCCLPFPECSTLCTPKTVVYCLFIRCLLIICCLPSQTSQNARPLLTLCTPKTVVYCLFIRCLLPPFPNFPECPTLCSPCAPANTFLSVSVLALSLLELTYYPNRVFELVFERLCPRTKLT